MKEHMQEERTDQIKVSVLVLTYNHEKYIRQALESVLAQNVDFRYEILVGDDASTDGTVHILREYEKKYPEIIRLFLSEQNQGTTKNAYRLFQQARGRYLASCEGDDYWTCPEKLQTQVVFLESNPNYIGCSHPVECVNEAGEQIRNKKLRWVSRKTVYSLDDDFKGIFLPGHSSSLLRRNIFLNPRAEYSAFWEYSRYVGDRTAAVLWASRGDFYRLDRTMSCYRSVAVADGTNVTSRVYLADRNKNEKEWDLTRKLENLAERLLNKPLYFDYYKCQIIFSALYKGLTQRRPDELRMAKNVWKDVHFRWKAVFYAPRILLNMAAEKLGR